MRGLWSGELGVWWEGGGEGPGFGKIGEGCAGIRSGCSTIAGRSAIVGRGEMRCHLKESHAGYIVYKRSIEEFGKHIQTSVSQSQDGRLLMY